MNPYERLRERGLVLPAAPKPIANFLSHVREGTLIFLSGQGPLTAAGYLHTGKVGSDVSVEQAYDHALLTGLNLLAVMQEALGDLRRVKKVVKLLGMVNAVPHFQDHPLVINGCSDLFVDVFGPQIGSHGRSAVGMGSLPGNITVEIEGIIAVDAD